MTGKSEWKLRRTSRLKGFAPIGAAAVRIAVGAAAILSIGCAAGPRSLRTAIDPRDEADYSDALHAAGDDARLAFAQWMAHERGATPEEILARDVASGGDNPFDRDDARTISRGAVLFKVHCAGCHGDDAGGGGPLENPDYPASNLRGASNRTSAVLFPGPSGQSLFDDIHDGHGDWIEQDEGRIRAMPAFSDQLTREQIWLLVTYLQSTEEK